MAKRRKRGDATAKASPAADLPGEAEAELKILQAIHHISQKYVWSAQHSGVILRQNPLKQKPLRDKDFNRLAKSAYGFRYQDERGRTLFWYPTLEMVFGLALEGEGEAGVITVEGVDFAPGHPEIFRDGDDCVTLNMWRPPRWTAAPGAGSPDLFLELLSYLFEGEQASIDHVLDFLAHLVQRPGERVGHALLITSPAQGIGKSTLGQIAQRLAGLNNTGVANTKDLKGTFHNWLAGKLVIQIDEVYESGNWELANALKPLITGPIVSANFKYGPLVKISNFARFIMFSNHTAPLSLEEGDRRFFVLNSAAKPRSDEYYRTLYQFIDSDAGMNAIYSLLANRNISTFNPHARPPMTAAKKAVIEASVHPLREYILSIVESGYLRQELQGETFSFDALQRLLQKDGYGQHAKNTRELGVALKEAGCWQTRETRKGRKSRVWHFPRSATKKLIPADLY